MSTTITIDAGTKTQRDALAECELKIARARRDTVESIRVIGRELIKIETETLYGSGHDSFKEYVEDRLEMDYKLARAWMRASQALDILNKQKLQLPYNQSQVLELTKIKDPETMARLWQQILDFCDQQKADVDYELVRDTVAAQRTKTNERQTRARNKKSKAKPGIEIDLGDNGAVRTSVWSEEGEKALNRIRRLCGDDIADAVNRGNPKISERDLRAWAGYEPDMVRVLSYYIVFKRWSLRKAINYEENAFNMSTTVEQLRDLARSRGGEADAQVEDLKIHLKIVA